MKQNPDRSLELSDDDFGAPIPRSSGGTSPNIAVLALQNKWYLLAALIVGLAAGEAAYVKLGPSYQATVRILVSKRTTGPLKEDPEAHAYGERGEHVALIMSPMIVGEAVKKYKLNELPSLKKCPDPVEEILEMLKIKRTAGSDRSAINVLDISYESRSKNDATAVVNAVAAAYRDYLAKSQKEHTTESASLIKEADIDLNKQLRDKEKAYIAFRERAPLHWRNAPGTDGMSGDTTNVHQEKVMAIEADRRTNLLRVTEIQSKLKAIKQAQEEGHSQEAIELMVRRFLHLEGANAANATAPTHTPVEISMMNTMENKLLPLMLEEKKLFREFGEDHPDVKAVRRSIKMTRDFYRSQGVNLPDEEEIEAKKDGSPSQKAEAKKLDLVAVYTDSLNQELVELEFRDHQLAALAAESSKSAKAFSRYQLEDQTLNDEIKRIKKLWETVVLRLDQINLTKDTGGYTMKTVAPARESLVVKRQVKIVSAGGAGGLLLAFSLIALRALCDTTLKTVNEVQRQLGLTILGRVPELEVDADATVKAGSLLDPTLLYFHKPASPEAEAYRSVRTALFVSTHSRGEKVIQVTSSEPQDGKTTLVSNLAIAMAQSGKKVLLIDADMRCPKVFKLFGFRQEIGLSDVLAGEVQLEHAVHATEVDKLSILGSGLSPANPAEMLGSSRFQHILRDVRAQFDYVLVDTPPLLAVSDPCIVAPNTDGLLLVVRLGKNRRDVVRRADELIQTHSLNVLGVVVNGVPAAVEYGGGYGSYSAYTREPAPSRPQNVLEHANTP